MGFSDYSDELQWALERIWKICHRPSSRHPKGNHAYTHFMADFDEIRAICLEQLPRLKNVKAE